MTDPIRVGRPVSGRAMGRPTSASISASRDYSVESAGVPQAVREGAKEPSGAVRKLCCGSVVDANDRLLVRHDCDLATMADSEGKVFHIG
jgi:hypothetical protein